MNKGEYGVAVRLGVGYDISGFSSLTLVFHKPSGAKLVVHAGDGVSAPNSSASGFSADEYFEYTTQNGDIDEEGVWTLCGIYVDNEKRLVSDHTSFTVTPGCETT